MPNKSFSTASAATHMQQSAVPHHPCNGILTNLSFRRPNRWKSDSARSRHFGGYGNTLCPNSVMASVVCTLVSGLALSWRSNTSDIFLAEQAEHSNSDILVCYTTFRIHSCSSTQDIHTVTIFSFLLRSFSWIPSPWECSMLPFQKPLLGFGLKMEEPGFNAHDKLWQEAPTSCILWMQDYWWLLFLPLCVHLWHATSTDQEQSRPSITMLPLPVKRVEDNSSIVIQWLPCISSSKPADAVRHYSLARATTP